MSANGLKDYYLIRCYEKPEYREGFNNGSNIHISHMNYFFHLESDFQRDAEGLVFQQPPNTKGIFFNAPKDMKERLLRDGIFVESNGQISIADSISKEDFVKYFNKRKASADHWMNFSVGSSLCHLAISQIRKDNKIVVEWYITDDKELYKTFLSHRNEIEKEMGISLDWRELPDKKASRILISHEANFENKDEWIAQFDWIIDVAIKMKKAFKKYL